VVNINNFLDEVDVAAKAKQQARQGGPVSLK
jgi:hypothetical protein